MTTSEPRFIRDQRPLGVRLHREVVVDTTTGLWAPFVTAEGADEALLKLNFGEVPTTRYLWMEDQW